MLVYKKVVLIDMLKNPFFYLPKNEYPGIGNGIVRGKKYCDEYNKNTWFGLGLGFGFGPGLGDGFGDGFGVVVINVDTTADNFIGVPDKKCRFRVGDVVEISSGDTDLSVAWYDASVYKLGKIEQPLFNSADGIGCFPGIHCFMTRQEAENYYF